MKLFFIKRKIIVLLCCLSTVTAAFAQEQLVFAVDVIRHGDRAPINDLPKSTHVWKEGLGQLTPRGMRQEYELGTQLRDRYINKYHLLPAHYQPGSLYVRSSDVDRTLMSAEALLMGLYPAGTGPLNADDEKPALPERIQVIPVHTVAKEHDDLILSSTALDALKQQNKANLTLKPAISQAQFKQWSEAAGFPITKAEQVMMLSDTLFIRKLYQVPLPERLSATDADDIIKIGRQGFANFFQSPVIGKKVAGHLLETIVKDLKTATTHPDNLKYELFSAHDVTLMALLSALSAPVSEPPRYASHLSFALFKNDENHYNVRIQFNGEPVAIPACNHSDVCSLQQLQTIIS